MKTSYLLAATAALAFLVQASSAPAQTAPAAGTNAAPGATTSAPAAPTPAATAEPTSQPTGGKKSASRTSTRKKMTRQQEIDHAIDTGTVPARYRSSVPRQYQHYIPFEKQ